MIKMPCCLPDFCSASNKFSQSKYLLILGHANILNHHTEKPWYPIYYRIVATHTPKMPKNDQNAFFLVGYLGILTITVQCGVLQLPYGNSKDTKASVYDELVCWHAPVSKNTQKDTICRIQSKTQANNKKKDNLVIYGYCGGVVATIQ